MNNGKICIPVCGRTADEMIAKIKQAESLADIIELRFDCLTDLSRRMIEEILEHRPGIRVIATFRPKEQGGNQELTTAERVAFWQNAPVTEFADLEEDVIRTAGNTSTIRICSHHDFSGISDDLDPMFRRLSDTGADIIKIAINSTDAVDGIAVWKLLSSTGTAGKEIIPIAMGEAGKWTRILGLAHGAFLTYGSLGPGSETASGQISAKDMLDIYRVKDLDEYTKVFGIIGDPVSQSMSPFMHNPAFVSSGLNAVFVPFLVKDLAAFVDRMVRRGTNETGLDFGGLSVTMPHKQAVIKYLDDIDETARAIGAVNTIKVDSGKLTGFNTDAHGFITPLKKMFGELKDSRIALFGAGGAARACVFALNREGAKTTVFARDLSKSSSFAEEFDVPIEPITGAVPADFDIMVDATPFGMKGELEEKSLFTAEGLKGVRFVYDLVTRRTDSPIIREAKAANIPAIGGLEMLVAQGVEQFRIWTGIDFSPERMRSTLDARLAERE